MEDALSLRISDVVPRHRSAFFAIHGTMTMRDPATGVVVSTITYSGEVRGSYGRVSFAHTIAGQCWAEPAYAVAIIAVDHPFGPRWRFLCPESGARVDVLHLPADADRFASRQAHGLSYATQSMRAPRRAEARARQIRIALGGSPDPATPFPDRPARMWTRVYDRLRSEAGLAIEGTAL